MRAMASMVFIQVDFEGVRIVGNRWTMKTQRRRKGKTKTKLMTSVYVSR